MNKKVDKEKEAASHIVASIKGVLDRHEGSWDRSFFFRATHRKLQDMIKRLEPFYQVSEPTLGGDADKTDLDVSLAPDEMMVYVHVYHAMGGRLASWISLARLVASSCASRPIYDDKALVEALLDRRGMPETEGYFVLKIKKADVLQVPDDRVMVDALGQPLLALKPGALRPDHLCYFSHGRYGFYRYVDNDFVLIKN